MKEEIVSKVHKFRQALRRFLKKKKRKDSNVSAEEVIPTAKVDPVVVGEYLDMVNDFIKNSIAKEMEEYIEGTFK